MAYEPVSPVDRAPLPPADDAYAPRTAAYGRAPPPVAYRDPPYASAEVPAREGERLVWHASKRWSEIRSDSTDKTVRPDAAAKFKTAQAKAEEIGVENLTQDDIAGLTAAQIKQLRGY